MTNKKSDSGSGKVEKDQFIEDLDEEQLKNIKGGKRFDGVNNDTLFAGPGDSSTLKTFSDGTRNDSFLKDTSTFDKLKR